MFLSNIERTAMTTTNPGEIGKMLLSKLEAVRSSFNEKEVKLTQSKEGNDQFEQNLFQ